MSERESMLPTMFVAVHERASGNESVGTEWLETRSFPPTATIAEVYVWAWEKRRHLDGRLMICADEATTPREDVRAR